MPTPDRSATALITGVTGQDGGYLAEQLVAGGCAVHAIIRPGERIGEQLAALQPSLVLHEVDLVDDAALRSVLRASSAREVYNLVGVSSVAQSWQEPALTAEINGTFVARLLHAVWDHQDAVAEPVRFVQASSAEIFAGASCSPQDERTPIRPRSPYGASKAFAHHLVQVFRERGLHACNAILYNHESPRRPPSFVTRKITSTVAAIADGRADRLVLGNLDARRDWGWAPEYVDAMVRVARHHVADDWVVATGEAHSVEQFVAAAFTAVGVRDWRPLVATDPTFVRPVDAVELVGDASRLREELGWAPQLRFAQIVEAMVEADLASR